MNLAITIALAILNLLTAILKLECFECRKRLKLTLVTKNGERSIECACCWKHQTARK